jgi:hypothetical protein
MPKAQIDTFMGTSQIEDSSAVRRVNPAVFGLFNCDGLITALWCPALHQVFLLQ